MPQKSSLILKSDSEIYKPVKTAVLLLLTLYILFHGISSVAIIVW